MGHLQDEKNYVTVQKLDSAMAGELWDSDFKKSLLGMSDTRDKEGIFVSTWNPGGSPSYCGIL